MRICALQMNVALSSRADNFRKAADLIGRAMSAGPELPDVLVLPELWDLGFISPRVRELADDDGMEARSFLGELASKHNVNIIGGSICRKSGDDLLNTLHVFDRGGKLLLSYDKIHLFSPGSEADWFKPGSKPGVCELDGQMVGVMTCYDLRFPELARTLALAGAKVIVNCSAWPHPRGNHWRLLCQARAVENQLYFVGCNCTGQTGKFNFCGGSIFVDPWGEILDEAGNGEAIVSGSCDFALQERLRSEIPVFHDRRPDVYNV